MDKLRKMRKNNTISLHIELTPGCYPINVSLSTNNAIDKSMQFFYQTVFFTFSIKETMFSDKTQNKNDKDRRYQTCHTHRLYTSRF